MAGSIEIGDGKYITLSRKSLPLTDKTSARSFSKLSRSSELFDAAYFAKSCGRPYQRDPDWLAFFNAIASRIASDINPTTVLDAGCAFGFLVESLRECGIQAFGVDISPYAIQNVQPDIQPFVRIGSVTEPFPQRYDLIVSIEVLEHLPKQEAEKAVENLCQHTDDILFSSTPFDYKEATHFNVQTSRVLGGMLRS